jgi:excisionase family DNA binding protein
MEGPGMGSPALSIDFPAEILEQVATRAAEIVVDRQALEADQPSGYLDVEGAAEFLACPKSRIYSLVSAGRIPHHRDGTRLLFDRGELREYVDNGGARRP